MQKLLHFLDVLAPGLVALVLASLLLVKILAEIAEHDELINVVERLFLIARSVFPLFKSMRLVILD